jgi:hypothetical protein
MIAFKADDYDSDGDDGDDDDEDGNRPQRNVFIIPHANYNPSSGI